MEFDSSAPEPLDPASIEELEKELGRLQAELAEYRNLIEQLPGIYESKFNHRVRDVAQEIRRLLDERQALQQQISHQLQAPPPPPALLSAAPESTSARRPFLLPLFRRPWCWSPGWPRWQLKQPKPWQLGLGVVATAVTAALIVAGSLRPVPRQPRDAAVLPTELAAEATTAEPSASVAQSSDLPLRLRAQGEAWVEVRDLAGEVVYVNTLRMGEEAQVRLGQGLRVRSGRPDLLEVALADQPYIALGPVYDLSSQTFLPPD